MQGPDDVAITFQVFRVDMGAESLDALAGKITEVKVGADFVSGEDSVADVKKKLRALLGGAVPEAGAPTVPAAARLGPEETITLYFRARLMHEDLLFCADHFEVLPVFVQVAVHACTYRELVARIRELRAREPDDEPG